MIISHKESGISQILIMTRLRTMRLMWAGEVTIYVKRKLQPARILS